MCATSYTQHVLYGAPANQASRYPEVVPQVQAIMRRANAVLNSRHQVAAANHRATPSLSPASRPTPAWAHTHKPHKAPTPQQPCGIPAVLRAHQLRNSGARLAVEEALPSLDAIHLAAAAGLYGSLKNHPCIGA